MRLSCTSCAPSGPRGARSRAPLGQVSCNPRCPPTENNINISVLHKNNFSRGSSQSHVRHSWARQGVSAPGVSAPFQIQFAGARPRATARLSFLVGAPPWIGRRCVSRWVPRRPPVVLNRLLLPPPQPPSLASCNVVASTGFHGCDSSVRRCGRIPTGQTERALGRGRFARRLGCAGAAAGAPQFPGGFPGNRRQKSLCCASV